MSFRDFIVCILGAMAFSFISKSGISQETQHTLRDSIVAAFLNSDSLELKQKYYEEVSKRFPEKGEANYDRIYDEMRRILALNYLLEGDTLKFADYTASIKQKVELAEQYNKIASHWLNNKNMLAEAKTLSIIALELNESFLENLERYRPNDYTSTEWKVYLTNKQYGFIDTYTYIIHLLGDSDKALSLLEPIYKKGKDFNGQLAQHYSIYLAATGSPDLSTQVIEETLARGYTSASILNQLKQNYFLVHGSYEGYDDYRSQLSEKVRIETQSRLKKKIEKIPAPEFSLLDLKGNVVSLADYRGKIVVLDFWSTWCGPCKESFKGMQLVINKYKDDPSVKFLFIDTWENGQNYKQLVLSYVEDSHLPFDILFDEHSADGKHNKIARAFDVKSIPSRFVIDGNGNIRFSETGYFGVPEDLSMKISEMIDLLLVND